MIAIVQIILTVPYPCTPSLDPRVRGEPGTGDGYDELIQKC